MDDPPAQPMPKSPSATYAVQESTLCFQAHLLDAVGQAIIATDPEGIITYWNDAAEALYGWSAEEVLGKNIVEVTPAESARGQAADIMEHLHAGKRWRGEFTVRHRDGTTFSVLVTNTPILNEQGALTGIVGVSTDLTEHKQAEAVLRESEERFRALFQGIPVPTFVWKQQGNDFVLVDFNTAAETSTQNKIGLHKGASLRSYLADRSDLIADIHRCFTNQETVTRETTHRFRTTGEVRDLVISLAYVPPDLVMAHTLDITERKRAEQALWQSKERLNVLHQIERATLNTRSPEDVAEVALAHIRHYIPCGWAGLTVFDDDAQEAQIFALDVDEESAFRQGQRIPLREIPGLERLQQGLTESIADIAHLTSTSSLLRTLANEGGRAAICVPLMVAGTLIGVLHLGSDRPRTFNDWEHIQMAQEVADSVALAFEHARLFKEVRNGHDRLQHLTRQLVTLQENERRRLARELHDEIGQALTVVKMNLHALQPSDEAASSSPHLDETIGMVEKLLEQVRTLSLDLRPSLLDDLGLVPAVRGLVHNVAQRAGMEAHVAADAFERLSPELAITCFRVVQEALTNAARHAQARHVYVILRRRDAQVDLTIRDDGTGFDVEAALEQAAHGTSLGLLNMQERVRLLGGWITIEAVPEQGTEIHVQLPLTPQAAPFPVEKDEAL